MAESPAARHASQSGPAGRVAAVVLAAMYVTVEQVEAIMARAPPVPAEPSSPGAEWPEDSQDAGFRAEDDPLVARGKEYAGGSLRVLQALRPHIARQGGAAASDALERLEEMCLTVASKIYRAVSSALESRSSVADPQGDANGSAKVALLLIEESRQAWRVLMQPGAAFGNGAPARFIKVLDELETGLHEKFPLALTFVRPGFDTITDGAAGQIARALVVPGSTSRH